ncbi:dihydrolipoyllysine-residue succinyltransferase component of 2-oxoglutarate dehydrogenase complex [Kurthia zopfii]|uniref:Dihydrolipoyllysine-residue succinyltransferase component of 2-oxoglutarate dehydrogenase complex n=1 Tax=Kurthia zopfii TaxID=1650 RepID=A0A8B4Q9U8_9BACL|nr:2-oxoglutarate dehydrogenase complex dihydrolipoyllysine-residue succinyltransferase [Kurthia zopfii]PWI21268.1 dihydrolipoamide succinyltransferase [Kurthia zopfii]TDR33937.1 2-oxoglutarate dehydrogenase E2 component [Kurthia zopfii]GEK31890.1 dihydrolipoyllysine-residue succinyltransferase component of 2-oxoglutarate dehydrogenase complex [Kurthia zopfii]STX09499.1 Dihydrolipoyllysine-residue succinyltransferase component of 2-oxoglutarate dehydrogenase complex [Kurthia zopfii]
MADIIVPELAESITEGEIVRWVKQVGDSVEKGEFIVELETDKVNAEIISEEAGVLTEILAQEGDVVEVGAVIAKVDANASAAAPAPAPKAEEAPAAAPAPKEEVKEAAPAPVAPVVEETTSNERVIASPAARKLAREKGIDLASVSPVDPQGRVRVQDVAAHGTAPAAPAASKAAPAPATKAVDESRVEAVKMTRRQQTAARKLLEVSQNTAMLTTFNEIDMTAVMALRKRKKDAFMENHEGTKLGFMSFFTKAVTAALKKYPAVNAKIVGEELHYNKFFDVGIAVATPDGLVVPNVRDTNRKNFAEIESDIAELAVKARNKKLALSDLEGGSFTITNGGVFGSLMSTPIINGDQAAILGMHNIVKRPIAVGDEIELRPMMYVALSYDHRIINGKESVGFLKMVKDLIENPEDLLLEA